MDEKEFKTLLRENTDLNESVIERLAHYAQRETRRFWQYDCFANAEEDSIVKPDEDGDAFFLTNPTELMHGATVRVLIGQSARYHDVVRGLLKILVYITKDGVSGWQRRLEDFGNIPF
jgi:hypothetical protein